MFSVTVWLAIFCVYIFSYVKKRSMLLAHDLSQHEAMMIDSLALIAYLVFFLTITGAAIYFKVLDRRHKM